MKWQSMLGVAGLIVGIAGTAITVLGYFESKQRFEITYTETAGKLTAPTGFPDDAMQINGKNVSPANIYLVDFKFWNSGNQSVDGELFGHSLTSRLLSGGSVLQEKIVYQNTTDPIIVSGCTDRGCTMSVPRLLPGMGAHLLFILDSHNFHRNPDIVLDSNKHTILRILKKKRYFDHYNNFELWALVVYGILVGLYAIFVKPSGAMRKIAKDGVGWRKSLAQAIYVTGLLMPACGVIILVASVVAIVFWLRDINVPF